MTMTTTMTKKPRRPARRAGLALGAALLSLLGAVALRARSEEPVRVVDITAKRFQFSPNEVALKRGEKVKLVLHSEDAVHGFFSRPLGIDTEVKPGTPTEVVITPQTAGRFLTICHHFCGSGHGNMNLTFVVE
jgi:cytochrome c oxidase subunit 2